MAQLLRRSQNSVLPSILFLGHFLMTAYSIYEAVDSSTALTSTRYGWTAKEKVFYYVCFHKTLPSISSLYSNCNPLPLNVSLVIGKMRRRLFYRLCWWSDMAKVCYWCTFLNIPPHPQRELVPKQDMMKMNVCLFHDCRLCQLIHSQPLVAFEIPERPPTTAIAIPNANKGWL